MFTESLCNNFCKKSRKFWNWVNASKGRCNPIPALTDNGLKITNDTEKAGIFNRYFHSVFTDEDMSLFPSLKLA